LHSATKLSLAFGLCRNPFGLSVTTVAISASVSHLPSNIAHQMLGQKYIFGVVKAA
jgi:hypothetical protein